MTVVKGQKLPGAGRPKGAPNRATAELKDMILKALDTVGGEKYLAKQAIQNPGHFMTLIGKVLPKDINKNVEGNISITSIVRKIVDADRNSDSESI
jgi:hypothetical protein